MHSRNCAPNNAQPHLLRHKLPLYRQVCETGMHFCQDKNAHLSAKLFSLCRINILPQDFSKIKSGYEFLYCDPIPQGNSLYYSHTVSNKTQETNNALGAVGRQFPGRSCWICTILGQKILQESFPIVLDFSGLRANKCPFILACPLSAIGVWVAVWVSRFDPYYFHL